ncbi:RIP metalloprotease RseP [candidate division WOR-3 bacterium]|nr:RIP metalloprotease RseP [candidate division WOR-3 bacterium]
MGEKTNFNIFGEDMNIISTAVLLGVLISFHEFGHFLFAKLFKVSVPKFSLGFGPKLIGFNLGGTFFQISAFPLGGYVKMKGEAENQETKIGLDKDDFRAKNFIQKTLIVFAGPLFNIFLAQLLIFTANLMMSGFYIPTTKLGRIFETSSSWEAGLRPGDSILAINSNNVSSWGDVEEAMAASPVVSIEVSALRKTGGADSLLVFSVEPDTQDILMRGLNPLLPALVGEISGKPAEEAGFKSGDSVIFIVPFGGIDDEDMQSLAEKGFALSYFDTASFEVFKNREHENLSLGYEVKYWQDLSILINSLKSEDFFVGIKRGEDNVLSKIRPVETGGRKIIGISIDLPTKRLGAVRAFSMSLEQMKVTLVILTKIPRMIAEKKITVRETFGGPVRVFQETSRAAKMGFDTFLFLAGFISLNLAIFNLLPILPLDGGHIFIYLIETLTRKKIPVKVLRGLQAAGFSLLLFLAILVTANDLLNIFL